MIGGKKLALLGSVALVLACGGDSTAPPPPTIIEVHVTTTGVDIPDGFTLAIDGQSRSLPANGTVTIETTPGDHSVAVSGFGLNCDLVSAPSSTSVPKGTTTVVDIQASCTPYLRNTILYTSEEFGSTVWAMRPDGSRPVQLSDNGIYAAPAVSPDGQAIAVSYYPWDGIYLLDRFGKERKQLIGGGNVDGAAAWSPDGTKLAFRRIVHEPYGDVGRIFIVNRDGSGLRQLTPFDPNSYTFDDVPSWSADGARIVFRRNSDISIINVDGSGLVSTGVTGDAPSWSRDGSHIAYQSVNGGNQGIWVMDMSFSPHQLTTPVEADQMPRWSPDGSQLVFDRVEGGVFHVYRMNADGSGVTKLSTSAKSDSWPNWSPSF